jgi:hypothetical protein
MSQVHSPANPGSAALPDGLSYREHEATAIPSSFLASVSRRAERTLTCATCYGSIPVGATYREDRLRAPVFGDVLASAICHACVAEGL